MTDQELLDLNQKGFIPGPGEKEKDFLERVQAAHGFFTDPPAEFKDMELMRIKAWSDAALICRGEIKGRLEVQAPLLLDVFHD